MKSFVDTLLGRIMLKITLLQVLLLYKFLDSVPEVRIPNGVVKGLEAITTMNRVKYFKFEGIPYAKPPVGELRFQPPIPPSNWKHPLKSYNNTVTCYQGGLTYNGTSEDCLHLSVYTPQIPTTKLNVSLPVLLYIHGGRFVDGSSKEYHPDFIIEEDIIFITVNYRLGVFGFLSTEDEVVPGNNGLKDQVLALQWVQNNIEYFGGDPKKVTITGHSSGAICVTLHLMNLKSKGLFRAAIPLSGNFLINAVYSVQPRKKAFKLLEILNKTLENSGNTTELVDILTKVPAEDLDHAAKILENYITETEPPDMVSVAQMVWGFVIEKENPHAFLAKSTLPLLKNGHMLRLPVLFGMVAEEAIKAVIPDLLNKLVKCTSCLTPSNMYFSNYDKKLKMGKRIQDYYTGGKPFLFDDAIKYYSDAYFNTGFIRFADLYSKFSKLFFFMFSYDGVLGHFDAVASNLTKTERVGHVEILFYLTCHENPSCDLSQYSEMDQLTLRRVVKIITNFVKYLHPLPEALDLMTNIEYPDYSVATKRMYLNINETLSIESFPKKKSFHLWKKFYDMVLHCPNSDNDC